MKRAVLAALAAAIAFTPAASSHIRGYQFAPGYIPNEAPVPAAEVGSYEKIRKIAVLSGIGATIDLQTGVRPTTKNGELPVAAWRLDDKAEALVRRYLQKRFTFAQVPYDRSALALLQATPSHLDRFEAFLKSVPAKDVDAFIVIRPASSSGGVQLETRPGGETILWVRYEMDVVDAHSLKIVARAASRVLLRPDTPAMAPGLVIGDEFKLDGSLTLSPEKQEKLRLITTEMLYATLVETMRALQFGVTLPMAKPDTEPMAK